MSIIYTRSGGSGSSDVSKSYVDENDASQHAYVDEVVASIATSSGVLQRWSSTFNSDSAPSMPLMSIDSTVTVSRIIVDFTECPMYGSGLSVGCQTVDSGERPSYFLSLDTIAWPPMSYVWDIGYTIDTETDLALYFNLGQVPDGGDPEFMSGTITIEHYKNATTLDGGSLEPGDPGGGGR